MSVVDSDYDEDDEYQQEEMEEMFSISPTVEECCDFDPGKEDGGSEFDYDDDMPAVNMVRNSCIDHEDDDDEDDDDDILDNGSASHEL